jgi:hypothetical protein
VRDPRTPFPPEILDAASPVVCFAGAVGDHLLTYPAVAALCDLFGGRAVLLTAPRWHTLLYSDLPAQARLALRVSWAPGAGPPGDLRTAGLSVDDLNGHLAACDAFVSVNAWHSPAIDALLETIDPVHSVGHFPAFGSCVPVDAVEHAFDLAFEIPRRLDASLALTDYARAPAYPAADAAMAAEVLARLQTGFRLLAVHMDTKPERTWSPDRVATVLDRFLEGHPDWLAVIVGGVLPVDVGALRMRHRLVSLTGLPLGFSFAIVAGADLFLGVDSCMLHCADLHRVPGVGLFGSTKPTEFGFRFAAHRHVEGGGMDAIEPAQVLSALAEVEPQVVDA